MPSLAADPSPGTSTSGWDPNPPKTRSASAYKAVELDQSLGDGPVQYREVEQHESELFMSYFKGDGIEYLPGGVASGFVAVDRDHFDTRLLHLKGKRTVRASPAPVAASSLCTDDSFILDMGMNISVQYW